MSAAPRRGDRLRIGLVCPYALDTPGGVQNHVLGLAGWLVRAGHEVAVLAPGPPLPGLLERHGLTDAQVSSVGRPVPLRYNGSVARVTFSPLTAARLGRWSAAHPLDLLHLHEPVTPSVSLLALLRARVPVVATFHTATPRSRSMHLAAPVLRRPIAALAERIAVSATAREVVRRHLGVDATVIPNGFDHADLYRADTRRRRRRVVFLGRLDEPRKGLPVLLRAWPLIRAAEPDAELVLAGAPGQTRADRLPDGVSLAGLVSDDERARLLSSAEVFVAPHLGRESFGLVVLEAMAARAVVVASDLPAFRDVLTADDRQHGHLFATGDHRALADAVVTAFAEDADGLDRAVDPAAAADAARRYDWSVIGPRVVARYRAALDQPGVIGGRAIGGEAIGPGTRAPHASETVGESVR